MPTTTFHRIAWRRAAGCVLGFLLAVATPPLAAQPGGEGASLAARMRGFTQALPKDPRGAVLEYFPRRGAWTWIVTTRYPSGRVAVDRREFQPSETLPAMEHPGPLCETFSRGGDAMSIESLMYRLTREDGTWRRAAGTRFVPPGAGARSATFLEWRREAGRWVVSALGEERTGTPRLLGVPANSLVRDSTVGQPPTLPLPADVPVAGGTRWYREYAPIVADDMMLTMNGPLLTVSAELLARVGTVNGVPAYIEVGQGLEVLYIPVDRNGSFQPYQFMTSAGCP